MTILPMITLVAAMALSGGGPLAPSPAGTPRPAKPAPTRTVPDEDRKVVHGSATWYDYRPGHAAAGPALRRALGKGWRGMTIWVHTGRRCVPKVNCVKVVLSDWCACKGSRVIDLDARSFAILAPLSRGVLRVKVVRV